MCVYMAFMCISVPFIHAVLVLRADNTFITFQEPRNIFLRRHPLRFSSYQNYLSSVCTSFFCPQLQSTHLAVLQQKMTFFPRIVSRFLNGETIADKLFD
jgi:hypothetical protein